MVWGLQDGGQKNVVVVNCNPETVSTDYDTSDRLYFEPLVEEYVQNIILKEKSNGNLVGIIAQFGGYNLSLLFQNQPLSKHN
jgi:carbamoyl-phosphate synthase large subunit